MKRKRLQSIVFLSVALVLALGIAWPGKSSATVPGVNELVSVDSSGTQANGYTNANNAISADGRYVAFDSTATNLVSGDTNGYTDVFFRDRAAGTTIRVSVSSSGAQGNDDSYGPQISYDGRYVVFSSNATNLVSGDTNAATDVFRYDAQTGTTDLVSKNFAGAFGDRASYYPDVSAEGRFITFTSHASNLVSGIGGVGHQPQVFIKDMVSGAVRALSTSSGGAEGNGQSLAPRISCDGGTVVFSSDASNLVSGDTNGYTDIMLVSLGWSQDIIKNVTLGANSSSKAAQVSCDGNYITYDTNASNILSSDTNGTGDVVRYNRLNDQNDAVSVTSSGVLGNSQSQYGSVSGDGRYIAFQSSATNFDGRTSSFMTNVFIRDMKAQTTELLTVSLGNLGVGLAQNPAISDDGSYASYQSNAENTPSNSTKGIVASDANGYPDIFTSKTGY